VIEEYGAGRYRDHAVPTLTWTKHGPSGVLAEINRAQVPTYHCNGWFDIFAQDTLLWFANFEGKQRVLMGDWSHAQMTDVRLRLTSIEQHRWYDYWLKGIENGVLDEAPIHYALMIHPDETEWRSAEQWPPADYSNRSLLFGHGGETPGLSINDGLLSIDEPVSAGVDLYVVNPTTTTGSSSRWDNAVGAAPQMAYTDLAANDRKCLTYTTLVLEEALEVVGHPVVELWLTASKGDANLHVLLEEIDDGGSVHYVTEGVLRAALRKTSDAPFNNVGLPYQRCFEADVEALPSDEPALVRLDLAPTATVFNVGHRLRVSIMAADADNTEPSPLEDNTLGVYFGGEHASKIELPLR